MSRPLLLLVAYHFPPSTAIGGARAYRFYKYLKRRGYDVHVLTAAQQPQGGGDVQYVPDPLQVHPRAGLAWQAERVAWKFLLRGELVLGWSERAFRAGCAVLKAAAGRDVTLLSSGPPVGVHLAGARLAQRFQIPWIADFRDPIDSSAGESAPLQKMIAPRLEYRVLKQSSFVLANTDAMRQRWAERYPRIAGKVEVLWNGFDPEDAIEPSALPARSRKILSHVGELYGGRTMRPILEAVGMLIARRQVAAGALQIRQIGPVEAAELPEAAFLSAAESEGWLEIQKPVPAARARELALESDALLLIQPHTAVQVPGKLYEYLRMGRPILAFVVKGSPVERILERAGIPYTCIYPEESAETMAAKFLEFLAKLTLAPCGPSDWFRETFDGARQAEMLDQWIRRLPERRL